MKKFLTILLVVLIFALFIVGGIFFYNAFQDSSETDSDATDLEIDSELSEIERVCRETSALYTQIREQTESSNFCDQDSDCVSEPYGSKACGGPKGFISYSLAAEDFSELELSIEEFKRLDQRCTALNRQNTPEEDAVSTCELELPPELECVENKCVEVTGN